MITFSQRPRNEQGEWTIFFKKKRRGQAIQGFRNLAPTNGIISKNAENKILEICQGLNQQFVNCDQWIYFFFSWITLNLGSHLTKKLFSFFNENPLKTIKIAFYFILKALIDLKIFKFLSCFQVMSEKQLDQEDKVNFKTYGVTTWLTIILHILPNISQSKGNKTMKFGQLIEYIKEIFLKKSCRK